MPRVYTQKAGKDYPAQGIKKGDTYYRWEFRYGGLHRSLSYPRPSQLTQSKWSQVLAAQERIEDADGDSLEEVNSAIEDAISEVETVTGEYRDADDAMGGHGGINAERADHLDGLQGELEDIKSRLEALEEEPGEEEPDESPEDLRQEALGLDWDMPG